MDRLKNLLYLQVDMAPLAVFRILMGLLMAAEGFGAIFTGWVAANYVDVPFTFNFIGFDFLQAIVGPQAFLIYSSLGVLGLMIAFGWHYRWAMVLYALLWSAVYLGQKTSYNNHYYLLMIFAFIFCVLPLHKYLSMDVRHGRMQESLFTSQWQVLLFKWLLLIVYVYAALAKIYPDWLDGSALRTFLVPKTSYPIIGGLFTKTWFIYFLAYGGIVFDLLIIPALWWRKTRKVAFGLAIFFHIFNSIVFQIGIFPYMMLIATVLYFDEALIRMLFVRTNPTYEYVPNVVYPNQMFDKAVPYMLAIFFLIMVLLPLRPFLYEGNVHWTEEGHRLSWHMMLRAKAGSVSFRAISRSLGWEKVIDPYDYMTSKMVRRMAVHPDMIWQYAQRLKREYQELGHNDIEIYANAIVSLNGRTSQQMIDPQVDLGKVPWHHFRHHPWILKEGSK